MREDLCLDPTKNTSDFVVFRVSRFAYRASYTHFLLGLYFPGYIYLALNFKLGGASYSKVSFICIHLCVTEFLTSR